MNSFVKSVITEGAAYSICWFGLIPVCIASIILRVRGSDAGHNVSTILGWALLFIALAMAMATVFLGVQTA